MNALKQHRCASVELAAQRRWVWRGNRALWHMTKQPWVKLPCREQEDWELRLQRGQACPGWQADNWASSETGVIKLPQSLSRSYLSNSREKQPVTYSWEIKQSERYQTIWRQTLDAHSTDTFQYIWRLIMLCIWEFVDTEWIAWSAFCTKPFCKTKN